MTLNEELDPLGHLAEFEPMLEMLQQRQSQVAGHPVASYAIAARPDGHELYLFGIDAARRRFALRFEPAEFAALIDKMQTQLAVASARGQRPEPT
jgi:hypothetical protein